MRNWLSAFACLSLFIATPAIATDVPMHLSGVERDLREIASVNPGNIGIAAMDLKTGQMISIEGDTAFPMASVVKVAIAAHYLDASERGVRSMDATIGGTPVRTLMARMLIHSDNRATDLILENLGGPDIVQGWMDRNGITDMRIDRTIAQLLAARRDLRDRRDSATPEGFVRLLQKIDSGAILNPDSRAYLLNLMAQCATGRNRLPGQLPGVRIEHKTGTLNGLSTDVGFITLPDGRRLAVAVFARYGSNRPAAIARAAKTIYDGFRIPAPPTYEIRTAVYPSGLDPLAPVRSGSINATN